MNTILSSVSESGSAHDYDAEISRLKAKHLALVTKVQTLRERVKRPSILKFLPQGQHLPRVGDGHIYVTEKTAVEIEATRLSIERLGRTPYFDFNHLDDGRVSFYPWEFYWRDGVEGGVWCKGNYSKEGLEAVKSGRYKYFSPMMWREARYGGQITCAVRAPANMGALTHWPLFGETMKIDPDLCYDAWWK